MCIRDRAWSDPQYMTDAEFFGVWDGSKWTTQGKLNYDYEGVDKSGKVISLKPVEEAVKAGDLTLAKDRLQDYYAARKPKTTISKTSRNTLWANALVDDFYHLQTAVYFQGEMWVGNEWDSYESNITTSYVSPGSIVCYGVRSWYNEASYLDIKRHDDANVNYRPRIDLTVNGAVKSYYAIDDTSVRAGQYKDCLLYTSRCV